MHLLWQAVRAFLVPQVHQHHQCDIVCRCNWILQEQNTSLKSVHSCQKRRPLEHLEEQWEIHHQRILATLVVAFFLHSLLLCTDCVISLTAGSLQLLKSSMQPALALVEVINDSLWALEAQRSSLHSLALVVLANCLGLGFQLPSLGDLCHCQHLEQENWQIRAVH